VTCPRCERVNAAGRRFCGGCGASLERSCARCAFVNDAVDRFCGGCGDAVISDLPRVIAAAGASDVPMLSAADLQALLGELAPAVAPAATLRGDGAINQDDLDRLFGASP
jgi:Double zinc ribbon